ncbi:Nonribosomal peptide synthetase 8 [Cytospora mali]|uniref:Nonribosomal peptide synthetase 8 n=1 Tax=Cytospora mali TaxID=578113 RepID=A0A194W2W1_CYTMA|nr:Nonribosomal peptide synthetase 8 [Valsa mali]
MASEYKTEITFQNPVCRLELVLAWATLLKDYGGTSNISFSLTDSTNCQSHIGSAKVITLDLNGTETVEDVSHGIEKQMLSDPGAQPVTQSSPFHAHLCILGDELEVPNGVVWSGLMDAQHVAETIRTDLMLTCTILEHGKQIRFASAYRSGTISRTQESRMLQQLETVLHQLQLPGIKNKPFHRLQTASASDIREIWEWNSTIPEPVMRGAIDMFSEHVRDRPQAFAIHAWDGDLTYEDVDRLSNILWSTLSQAGVGKGTVVPLCFEKSVWAPVSILAVVKTGAAFVLLDEDLPQDRLTQLSQIIRQEIVLILASTAQQNRARLLAPSSSVFIVDAHYFETYVPRNIAVNIPPAPSVEPSDIIYIVFTSGTTGVPKAALIRHSNICSFVTLVGKLSRISSSSRILALASYAYDVSLGNIFMALLTGACLCIPSSWECKNDVARLINSYRITHVQTTPSVSKMMHPSEAQSLEVLDLCGEACSEDALAKWRGSTTRVMNTYSPAECTITSVVNQDVLASSRPSIIGRVLGAGWVVDPIDRERLTPIGGIGELLLEGPLVGAGYLHSEENTKAAFVTSPEWLLRTSSSSTCGRQGQLYVTGDLVRYTDDGEIEIIGRRDSQVKIRGQRVELGEVSAHLQTLIPPSIQWCPVVVKRTNGAELLFVVLVPPMDELASASHILQTTVAAIDPELRKRLPRAMVPSAYACIDKIPLSLTGKTDHAKLKQLVSSIPADRILFPQAGTNQAQDRRQNDARSGNELNRMEASSDKTKIEVLRQIWSEVFNVNKDSIQETDTFFSHGGESIAAIRLVAIAARKGLGLDVATVFRHPQLCEMAFRCKLSHESLQDPPEAFSLLRSRQVLPEIAAGCNTPIDNLEDAYPCTPLQEGLMITSKQHPTVTYRGRQVLNLPKRVDVQRLVRAWQRVAVAHSILRTRIIDTESEGLLQVVLKEGELEIDAKGRDLASYIEYDDASAMCLGTQLCRWSVVRESASTYFVLTMHHAIYDGWTLPRIGTEVFRAYRGERPHPSVGFNVFIRYITTIPKEPAEAFWVRRLAGPGETTVFPVLPQSIYVPKANATLSRSYPVPTNSNMHISLPSLLRAAWALLAGRLSASDDIVFGTTVSGRNVAIDGVEDLLSPTISTVPVRVRIDHCATVRAFVEMVQNEALETMPFELIGLQAIKKINSDTRSRSQFQTLFIVHPPSTDLPLEPTMDTASAEEQLGMILHDLDLSEYLHDFNEYALMILVSQRKDFLVIEASYDSKVLNSSQMERLLDQFMHVSGQLGRLENLDCSLDSLTLASSNDIESIWAWNNATLVKGLHERIHDVIGRTIAAQPHMQAICAWDGSASFEDLDRFSARLARLLRIKGVNRGSLVHICMEKSMWAAVAMLGILRAGAAFTAMDVRHQPKQRLQSIIKETSATIVVTTGPAAALARELSKDVIDCDCLKDSPTVSPEGSSEVTQQTKEELLSSEASSSTELSSLSDEPESCELHFSCDESAQSPTDTAFVVFSSGSTGVPKGIKISHEAFCTTIQYHSRELHMSNLSRVYDFASYSFDIAVHNALMTLALGGCLCVPSEAERENEIEESLQRLQANWADLTPSIARIMEPSAVPGLQTLVLSGEAVGKDLIAQWTGKLRLINAYGPAECQICTVQQSLEGPDDAAKIGRGVGCATWIVDLEGGNTLLPIGAIGELVIEGPIISHGYLNAINDVFIKDPSWLLKGSATNPGRAGTVYRTGDLARYLPDGTIIYEGRATAQTKINGQRIELGEIEYQVRCAIPGLRDVVVDVVSFEGLQLLCAFLLPHAMESHQDNELMSQQGTSEGISLTILKAPKGLDRLKAVLPSVMVPSVVFKLSHIPLTPTRKVDRRKLKDCASRLGRDAILSSSVQEEKGKSLFSSVQSLKMRNIWSHILKLDPSRITVGSDFFQLGGDSISAMRLVKQCRQQGISLTVADVFRHSHFGELDWFVNSQGSFQSHSEDSDKRSLLPAESYERLRPFGLLADDEQDTLIRLAEVTCDVPPHRVLDIYACTPFQEAVFAATTSDASAYVQHTALRLGDQHKLHRVLAAWDSVIASNPVLRTRIIQSDNARLMQVVVRELQDWQWYDTPEDYLAEVAGSPMGLGTPLSRFALVRGDSTSHFDCTIIWTMHHALYDAWTTSLILREVSERYFAQVNVNTGPDYSVFVRYVHEQEEKSMDWWLSRVKGASEATAFPKAPMTKSTSPSSSCTLRKQLMLPQVLPPGYTTAVLIRCAWAILMARHANCEKVLFGETRLGRNVPIGGIEVMRGPTIATVPVLLDVRRGQTIGCFISEVREKGMEMQTFEHLGLQNIRRLSEDGKAACGFRTLLVFQDGNDTVAENDCIFEIDESMDDIRNFHSYPMTIVFNRIAGGIVAEAIFEDPVISAGLVEHLLQQVESIFRTLCEAPGGDKLAQLDLAGSIDLERIWNWNAVAPETVNKTMHELVAKQAQQTPDALAILAHDGQMTYSQLERFSSGLAAQLRSRGVGVGCFVPLCFEKSLWVPVAMLAVLKTGAAFSVMDVSHPETRLKFISTSLCARLIVSSPLQQGLASKLSDEVILVEASTFVHLREMSGEPSPLDASHVMYVCFTSGSTGMPKGVMEVPTMKRLFLGGEAVTPSDVSLWADHLELWGGYGPTEATPISLLSRLMAPEHASNIGRAIGLTTWICNPDNPNELVAVGAVGELVLDGPLVSLGYLGDHERSEAAFIQDPKFLIQKRRGRLYRTGDLVRYAFDGSIEYLGRADSQVKLRGQRIEFGEIEYHLKGVLPTSQSIVCEVIAHQSGRQMLVAFCALASGEALPDEADARDLLRRRLPPYMIPEAFLAVDKIPTNSSGKVDRRELKLWGPGLLQLRYTNGEAKASKHAHRVLTATEATLQGLWAASLHRTDVALHPNSNFFDEGGDSIAAMKLSNLARRHNLVLPVHSVMQAPRLSDMAHIITTSSVSPDGPAKFVLIEPSRVTDAMSKAAAVCGLPMDSIEDIYPCTPLQVELFALTMRRSRSYIRRAVYELPNNIDLVRLMRAWDTVVEKNAVLRTRFVDIEGLSLHQVVAKGHDWDTCDDLGEYLNKTRTNRIDLGSPLSQLAVIHDKTAPKIVWTVHHAVYDGWSVQVLDDQLRAAYQNEPLLSSPPFSAFVKHVVSQDVQAASRFWGNQLKGCGETTAIYPPLQFPGQQPQPTSTFKRTLQCRVAAGANVQATIHAAWSLIVSKMSERDDIVFAATLAGRDAPVQGIQQVVGPTIAPVPIRVQLDSSRKRTVQQLLNEIGRNASNLAPYQHIGTRNIESISNDTRVACSFRTLLVVTPSNSEYSGNPMGEQPCTASYEVEEDGGDAFHTFPLVLFFNPSRDCVALEVVFDPAVLEQREVERLSSRLESVIGKLNNRSCLISDVECLGKDDFDDILSWNLTLPSASERLLHHVVLEGGRERMNKIAVDAWDRCFSYAELEELSRLVGRKLREHHAIQPGSIVPILSPKSGYVPVAALAILRIGAAFLPLDASQPVGRLEAVLDQVKPPIVLATRLSTRLAAALGVPTVFVDDCLSVLDFEEDKGRESELETGSTPDDVACILYTSGSTGSPKGVMQTHRALSSAIMHQASESGFTEETRAFEFAAYSFDVSWNMIFKTLAAGGTLCVPREEDRIDDLAGALYRSRATLTELTASVARLLQGPEQLPFLQVLILSGEPVDLQEFAQWEPQVRLLVCYGPSECTSVSTINPWGLQKSRCHSDGAGIGKASGCVTWIVDSGNHRRLLPVGAVGEILIEGPIVGKGYYKNEALTSASYISDLPQLGDHGTWGHTSHYSDDGRPRVAFKSGDLARYDSSGNLHFVSRKDTQVKLHGQRIELEEVQHHVRAAFGADFVGSVIACVIPSNGSNSDSEQMLAAFLSREQSKRLQDHCTLTDPSPALLAALEEMDEKLGALLPRYMIPAVYYFVTTIPSTANGKVHRKRLVQVAVEALPDQIYHGRPAASLSNQATRREVSTPAEAKMQLWWATVLGREAGSISASDNFFDLRGDSISAMRLVAMGRGEGFDLRVSDVFANARLSDLALKLQQQNVTNVDNKRFTETLPFSLLGKSVDVPGVRNEVAAKCAITDPGAIEDVYPCTPLQESMLAASIRDPGSFVSMRLYRIPPSVDLARLVRAWAVVVQRNRILRTRLVDLNGHGLTQAVIREEVSWKTYSSTLSFLEEANSTAAAMCHGSRLMQLAVIEEPQERRLVWIIHHATYDGWILPIIEKEVQTSYLGQAMDAPNPDIRHFIEHLLQDSKAMSVAFWQQELQDTGEEVTVFPSLPNHDYNAKPVSYYEKRISTIVPRSSAGMSFSAFIYATWSLLVSQLTGGRRVTFGAILTGRNAPVDGIDRIMGPTITTVPVLVDIQPSLMVREFVTGLRDKTVAMIPHEHLGIHNIRGISGVSATAYEFETVLVLQPPQAKSQYEDHQQGQAPMEEMDETRIEGFPDQHGVLNQYGLMMELMPNGKGEMTVRASFDSEMISVSQMQRIISQWEHIMQQMSSPANDQKRLAEIAYVCQRDLEDIWTWNKHVPLAVEDKLVHQVISEVAQMQPEALALDGWDRCLTYEELDRLSSHLSGRLILSGIGPGCFVPLIFEKSIWANVSMLAVLKAGGAFVPLDADNPEGRLRAIMQSLQTDIILCSAHTRDRAARLATCALLVNSASFREQAVENREDTLTVSTGNNSRGVQAGDVAYAVFTSGSTGVAKGVRISHANLATAIRYQAGEGGYGLNSETRVLDSSSYAFDACVCNFFYTLTQGGCLCVPDSQSLRGDITAFMRDYKVNWAQLVPSVARTVDAENLPDLECLVLTGEPITQGDVDTWSHRVRLINAYGPTECTILCAISSSITKGSESDARVGNIGRGKGANLWLSEIGNPDRLAPVGAIGEILIEGPIIGVGYLGPYEYPLVRDPTWLLAGTEDVPGRSGTLFRTGDQALYRPDGSVVFVGRIGSEIKLRGQRVDLMGIEDVVRRKLPSGLEVVADIIHMARGDGHDRQTLLLFVSEGSPGRPDTSVSTLRDKLYVLGPAFKTELNAALPKYMQPEAFAPISSMPKTSSGKTDRRRLKEIGKQMRLQQVIWISGDMAKTSSSTSPPTTSKEKLLAGLWARILGIEYSSISLEDDFFQLGGDSLGVMRLTTAIHEHNFLLKASDVFRTSKLRDLAHKISRSGTNSLNGINTYAPWSLVSGTIPDIRAFIRDCVEPALGIPGYQVQDILPTNGFQVDYMHNAEEPLGLQYAYLDIGPRVRWGRLVEACRSVVQSFQCLRARFVCHQGRYYQIILRDAPLLTEEIVSDEQATTFCNRFCPADSRSANVSDVLTKLTLVKLPQEGRRRVILRMSHMQNDGWCTVRILRTLELVFNGDPVLQTPDWTSLLQHRKQTAGLSREYWRRLLSGTVQMTPPLIFKPQRQQPNIETKTIVRTLRTHALPYFHLAEENRRTRPTVVVNVAWSLVLQKLLAGNEDKEDHTDIVFGNVTTGRNGGGMPGLDAVIGPCVNMLPVRLRLPNRKPDRSTAAGKETRQQILRSLVESSAQQVDERTAFEGLDWDDMTESCTAWPRGTRYASAVHFRNMAFEPELALRVEDHDGTAVERFAVVWYELVAKPHWTTVLVYPEGDVLRLWLLADPAEIGEEGADEILSMLAEFVDEIIGALSIKDKE